MKDLGFKFTCKITITGMVFVGDLCYGNTSQRGDGHVGSTTFIYPWIATDRTKYLKSENSSSLTYLALLTGDTVMCVIDFCKR